MSLKKSLSKTKPASVKQVIHFLLSARNINNINTTVHSSTINEIKKKKYRILVIDDDDGFRKSLCFKLRGKFGAEVEQVNSGKLGIEKLNTGNTYDLIFTDIMMPEMTGIETYYEMRKIDSKIQVIIMSAYSNSEEWKKALTLNDIHLLHKPIPEDRLIEILTTSKEIK